MASLKTIYERFLKIRGSPHEIALGFAVGVFVGCLPYLGLQTLMALLLAAGLKGNKIAAVIGIWISNPITAPFLYGLTYYVGVYFFPTRRCFVPPDSLDGPALWAVLKQTPELIWSLSLGGVVVGLPAALLGYYLAFSAVSRYQDKLKQKLAREKAWLLKKREELKRKKTKRKKSKRRKKG